VQGFRRFMIAFSMIIALTPIALVALAALLGIALGCDLNDAAPSACEANGSTFGLLTSELPALAMNGGEPGYLVLAAALIGWGMVEAIHLGTRWARR
jgi:hypothetical protein